MACSLCRRRKLNCDADVDRQICSNCVKFQRICVHKVPHLRHRFRKSSESEESRDGPLTEDTYTPTSSVSIDILAAVDAFAQYSTLTDDPPHTPDDSDTPSEPYDSSSIGSVSLLDDIPSDWSPALRSVQNVELVGTTNYGQTLSDGIKEELTDSFFRDVYPGIPIIHQPRYHASLKLAPELQPPLCLRYAMWALAAIQSLKWSHLANFCYEKARAYLEQDETSATGTEALSVAHVQTWSLIATYESYMLLSLRTWSSIRRASALAHVLRLHNMDGPDDTTGQLLPDTHDPAELEERRRAFWSAFSGDRWISSRTGYPLTITEHDITTKLPSSEQAFVSGSFERVQSLEDVLDMGFDPSTSLYGARAVVACVLGRIMRHIGSATSSTKAGGNEKFWAQHFTLDGLLSKVSSSRSENLRPSNGVADPKLWVIEMWLHGLTICLHHAAIDRAKLQNMHDQIAQSLVRCREAANQIIAAMRSIAHIEARKMDPFSASTVYMASTVLIQGHARGDGRSTDIEDLRYLQRILELMHKHWKVTEIFINQFNEDLAKNGISLMLTPDEEDNHPPRKRVGSFLATHRRSPSERMMNDLSGTLP